MKIASLGDLLPDTINLYAWGDGQVLKLYDPDAPPDGVTWIASVDRALFEAGLPVPAVGETLEIEGCLGQVYERIEGPTIAAALFGSGPGQPGSIVELSHTFAEVHAEVHGCGPIPVIDSQQHAMSRAIGRAAPLPASLKSAALDALSGMPAGDRLCHGDYHPYNVILSPRGPIVIDWPNCHIGDPLEDVARTMLIVEGAVISQPTLAAEVDRFRDAYLERYFELQPGDPSNLTAWRPIVAAVRLTDGIPELETWLVEQVRNGLGV